MDWDKLVKDAEMEQAIAAIVTLATLLRHYYTAMTNEGFSKAEALALTISFQAAQMQSQRDSKA